jgi:hypothetical protein
MGRMEIWSGWNLRAQTTDEIFRSIGSALESKRKGKNKRVLNLPNDTISYTGAYRGENQKVLGIIRLPPAVFS